jgi:hypothetical protein
MRSLHLDAVRFPTAAPTWSPIALQVVDWAKLAAAADL